MRRTSSFRIMIVTCVLGTAKQPTPLDRLVDIAVYDPVHHFGGRDVIHYHQAIAVVVADSFETARTAANLLIVNYEVDGSVSFDLSAHAGAGEFEPRVAVGDFEAAFRDAPVKLDKTYTTPAESHAMMEPRATLASWDDDRITLWTSNQMITWSAQSIAKAFSIPPENVRLDSPYIGGGFGTKIFVRADAILAGLAARKLGRPVKVSPAPIVDRRYSRQEHA
ncbi:molybdopterin cofactor-binding domain-containing protein [Agrobacterium sp. 22-214-1]